MREHFGAVADAVASGVPVQAYLHWSLVDNYEWGTYEPRFGLFGMDRSDPDAPRWLDTDTQGDDAAGEYARVLAGLRAGDRTVLEPARLTAHSGGDSARRRLVGAGPSISRRALRRWRMTRTTMTTRMRPSRTSEAMPVAFSTRWPTK